MINNLLVELNGAKYVCWYYEDEYDMETALHLTPLEDWLKLQKEYPDEMDRYYQFSGFIRSYDEIKENIEEMREEEFDISIDNVDEVVNLLNAQDDKIKEQSEIIAEQGCQLDFLKDENIHMREVLEKNKRLENEILLLKSENIRLKRRLHECS